MWYEFNQGSGDTLVDYSGNGNDGTLQNSPTWVGGGDLTQNGGDLAPVSFPRYWDKTGFQSDVENVGPQDGFEIVGRLERIDGRFDDLFTNHFTTDDFPDFEGEGNYIHVGFYAKWDQVVGWGVGQFEGEWVVKPDPDPNKYQYYEARSDGQNGDPGEYFRMYYSTQTSGPDIYVADPDVWKEGVDSPYRTINHTLTGLENGESYVTRASVFTDHEEVFDR
ncbi:hypothetical protein Z052_02090 [Halorubrum sp. C191]|nr:hypothetical protein Z052_02090 [Halorubrum sp. C191]